MISFFGGFPLCFCQCLKKTTDNEVNSIAKRFVIRVFSWSNVVENYIEDFETHPIHLVGRAGMAAVYM